MIGFIVAGIIIGFIARALLPGRQKLGLGMTLLLGLLGSIVGGTLANVIGAGSIFELNVTGFIAAVAVSVGLLAVAERIGPGDRGRLGPGPRR